MRLMQKTEIAKIGLLAGFILFVCLGLYQGHLTALMEAKQVFLKEQSTILEKKSQKLETVFREIYQGARTISLLPGVRDITGANLPENAPEKFDQTRFSQEAHMTVQQIYNNLADNIDVSEIYCILKDFKPENGEKPFFMYDEIIIQRSAADVGDAGKEDEDIPEESEEAEYAHYKKQLDYFARQRPKFEYSRLEEIPMITSPPMRTCDNTQYLSKKEGDVTNTYGLLFSVPFYSQSGDFSGIISVIVRQAVFEALLLDVPFIIATDKDRQKAAAEGWQMPKESSPYLLANETMGIAVFDRRAAAVFANMDGLKSGADKDLILNTDLNCFTDSKWQLTKIASMSALEKTNDELRRLFQFKLAIVLIIGLAAALLFLNRNRQHKVLAAILEHMETLAKGNVSSIFHSSGSGVLRRLAGTYQRIVTALKNKAETAEAIAAGNLAKDVSILSEQDLLGKAFQNMITNLNSLVSEVMQVSDAINTGSQTVSGFSRSMAQGTTQTASSLEQITSSMAELESRTQINADNSAETNRLAERARAAAEKGSRQMAEMLTAMDEINAAAQKISNIAKVIDSIAFQTNLLALNASVEAARAGKHGKGFVVVAQEVRNLAARSATAARETAELIQRSVDKTVKGSEIAGRTAEALQEILSSITRVTGLVTDIAAAGNEQAQGIAQINVGLGLIDQETQKNAAIASDSSEAAATLSHQSNRLRNILTRFSLAPSNNKGLIPPKES